MARTAFLFDSSVETEAFRTALEFALPELEVVEVEQRRLVVEDGSDFRDRVFRYGGIGRLEEFET